MNDPSLSAMTAVPDSKFDRLKAILRTMFQLDRVDLDFGLYRIMNRKAGEITHFLDTELLPQVRAALAGNSAGQRAALNKELEQARQQARGLGVDPDTTPAVRELQRRYANAGADANAEAEVYNHLTNFFSRYYDEGDFMSLRRYSGGGRPTYLIPYNGEEVKLHWANADQYYVKSTENYAAYVFTLATDAQTRRVRFEITRADTERDNVKETAGRQRCFVLAEDPGSVVVDKGELVVRFEHRPLTATEKKAYPPGGKQQDRINEAAHDQILKALPPDWLRPLASPAPSERTKRVTSSGGGRHVSSLSQPERTVLDKHLAVYTAKNSFDYFIHKDLGGFLRRELDLYLKTEVLDLDDLAMGDTAQLNRALGRLRAVRQVADKIIAFLSQIEDFQKQLWLKKKFVLDTHYCVTLDRVPEAFYPAIAANKAQHDEWLRLFAIDRIDAALTTPGYTNPLTVEFLKANPFLVLDTRHFDRDLSDRLLAALSDAGPLDEQLDGLLVHGENFQALHLLQTRYQGQVQCVYIDPPYNTGNDDFLYKDSYEDSSWLSMMQNRLTLAYQLLDKNSGSHAISIDDRELSALLFLLRSVALEKAAKTVTVKMAEPTGVKMAHVVRSGGIPKLKEYIVLAKPSGIQGFHLEKVPKEQWDAEYNLMVTGISHDEVRWLKDIIHDSNRTDGDVKIADDLCQRISLRPVAEILTENGVPSEQTDSWKRENAWRIVRTVATTASAKTLADEKKRHFPTNCFTVVTSLQRMYVMKAEYEREAEQPRVRILFADDYLNVHPGDFWQDIKTTGLDNEGGVELISGKKPEKLLKRIIGMASSSGELVCDYFLGSGTTTAVAQKMGRKWLGVESAPFFASLPLKRMKLVLRGEKGGVSEEESWKGGGLFKYIRLESHEDTLDSLELTPRSDAQEELLTANPALAEDYLLRYALGEETAASACLLGTHFTDPFAYTLSVVRDGSRRQTPVDLPQTFNYLLGLRVSAWRRLDGLLTITGTDAQGQRCLILWRNLNDTDNAGLSDWFTRHRPAFADPFDLLYVNGDHTLNALRQPHDTWTAHTSEPVFRELMFANTQKM